MLLAFAAVLLGSPVVHADTNVSFADDQPLVVDLSTSPVFATVLVVNSSTAQTPVRVTLVFAGLAAPYLSTADPQPVVVLPGITRIAVSIAPDAAASTGTLILTGSDGSVDREQIRLVGALPPDQEPSGTLIPGTFDTLWVHATSFVPSFFRPPPSAKSWGIAGFSLLVVAMSAFLTHWAFHGKMPAALTTLIGAGLVAAALCALVLLGGWAASLIDGELPYKVPAQNWSVAPPASGRVDADLIGDNGQLGLMTVIGPTLTIAGLPAAGIYTGTIDTQPASDAGVIKVTVVVRDWWVYAFLAVLLGVVLGSVISRFSLRRPARQQAADEAAVLAAVARQESNWDARSVGQAWGPPYLFADYARDAISRIRGSAGSDPDQAATALEAFRDLDKAMEALRQQVASLGDERSQLCAGFADPALDNSVLTGPGWLAPLIPDLNLTGRKLEDAQTAIDARANDARGVKEAADLAASYATILDEEADAIKVRAPDARRQLSSLWVSLVQDVLGAKDKESLEALRSRFDDLTQRIADNREYRGAILHSTASPDEEALRKRAERSASPPAQRAPALAEPEQEPSLSAPPNRDTLVDVTVETTRLTAGIRVYWAFSDGLTSATFTAPSPGKDGRTELSIRHCFVSGPDPVSANLMGDDDQVKAGPWLGRVGTFSAARRLRAALAADDRVVAMVAAVLAVGSGMAALYLNTPAWGSAGDYVTALLWGSVTSEGVKLIVNVAGKRWPISA